MPTNPLDVSAVGTTVITTSQVLRDQNYSFTLPTTPKYSSTTTNLGGLVRGSAAGTESHFPSESPNRTYASLNGWSIGTGRT